MAILFQIGVTLGVARALSDAPTALATTGTPHARSLPCRPTLIAHGSSSATGSGATVDTGADGSGSGLDTTADVADTTVEPACTALAAGSWNVNGSCIGMLMTGDMTLDASGCSFTLGGWNMAMDIPAGGTVEGDTVTFTGLSWTGCTGTVASTGLRVDATCPAAGGSPSCSFTMLAR